MSNIKINGQDRPDVQIVKLQQGKVKEAIENLNSADQGADDVVFQVGGDSFVATGRDLFAGKPTAGKPFTDVTGIDVAYQGKKGKVLAWDNQANNGQECMKWAGGMGLLAAVAPIGISTALGAGITIPAVGIGLLLGGAVWGAAYLYGAHRKFDPSLTAQYGAVQQENTQSKGGWGEAVGKLFGRK